MRKKQKNTKAKKKHEDAYTIDPPSLGKNPPTCFHLSPQLQVLQWWIHNNIRVHRKIKLITRPPDALFFSKNSAIKAKLLVLPCIYGLLIFTRVIYYQRNSGERLWNKWRTFDSFSSDTSGYCTHKYKHTSTLHGQRGYGNIWLVIDAQQFWPSTTTTITTKPGPDTAAAAEFSTFSLEEYTL